MICDICHPLTLLDTEKTLHTPSTGQSESKNTYSKQICSTGQRTTYMHANLASNTYALFLCIWEKL